MKVSLKQALLSLNGKTSQEVYDSLDFNALPYDEENNRYPTLEDIITAIQEKGTNSE